MLLTSRIRMQRQSAQAELYLDCDLVGTVELRGVDTSWTFGEFTPRDCFSKYAPLFGQWSMLMHEDVDRELHSAASDELRKVEVAIDRLDARLHYANTDKWERISQVNIDGNMIEWKTL